jgi:hypothetical protein
MESENKKNQYKISKITMDEIKYHNGVQKEHFIIV